MLGPNTYCSGQIITLDAMGAQRDICQSITEQEGDYVISLKGHQSTLHKDVSDFFHEPTLLKQCLCFEENDKGHGCIEQRTTYVSEDIAWWQKTHQWPGLKSTGMVTTAVSRQGKIHREQRFT